MYIKKLMIYSLFLSVLITFYYIDIITFFSKDIGFLNYIFNVDTKLKILTIIYSFLFNTLFIFLLLTTIVLSNFAFIFIFIVVNLFFIDNYIYILNGLNIFRIGINDNILESIILSMKETSYITNFLEMYIKDVLIYIVIPTLITLIILILIKKNIIKFLNIKQNIFKSLFIIILIIILLYCFFPFKYKSPYFIKPLYITVDFIIEKIFINREREIVNKSFNETNIKNIIYIMDESVGYDNIEDKIIDFNIISEEEIFNLGKSFSNDNCSFGAREKNIIGFKNGMNIKTSPTFFQYAKKANYKTFILDNQENFLFNGLTNKDKQWIDEYKSFTNIEIHKRDNNLIKEIEEILNKNQNEKKFIYIKKYGSHFNYINNYPNELITKYGYFNKENSFNENNYKNIYKNSVYWNTEIFFEKLYKSLNLKDTLILYTSDHGELNYFDKEKNKFINGHCFNNDKLLEVPIVIISKDKTMIKNYKELYKENYNSHLGLFHILIESMGF